jgi:micrococcal nuclease
VLVSACSSPTATPGPASDTDGTVTRVVDGDTVHVGAITVRLLGIDCPETVKPHTAVQCGGPQASAFAHQLLDGAHVTLAADPAQADKDRYGRSLRYLRLDDGRDFSKEIVAAGWARVYTFHNRPVSEYAQLEQAQTAAQTAHRGLWGSCPDPAPGD